MKYLIFQAFYNSMPIFRANDHRLVGKQVGNGHDFPQIDLRHVHMKGNSESYWREGGGVKSQNHITIQIRNSKHPKKNEMVYNKNGGKKNFLLLGKLAPNQVTSYSITTSTAYNPKNIWKTDTRTADYCVTDPIFSLRVRLLSWIEGPQKWCSVHRKLALYKNLETFKNFLLNNACKVTF